MKNEQSEIVSEIKKNIDLYTVSTQRLIAIQDVMVDTLEEMIKLEKKESKTWRYISFVLLIFLTLSVVMLFSKQQ